MAIDIPVADAISGWTAWWFNAESEWELFNSFTADGVVTDGLSLGSDATAYPAYGTDRRSMLYFPLDEALEGQTPTRIDLILWTNFFWDGVGSGTFYLIPITDSDPEGGPPITISTHHPAGWVDKSIRAIWSIAIGDFEAAYGSSTPVQVTIPIPPELIEDQDIIGFQTAILTDSPMEDRPDSSLDFQKAGHTWGGGSGPILRLLYDEAPAEIEAEALLQLVATLTTETEEIRVLTASGTAIFDDLQARGRARVDIQRDILTHKARQHRGY